MHRRSVTARHSPEEKGKEADDAYYMVSPSKSSNTSSTPKIDTSRHRRRRRRPPARTSLLSSLRDTFLASKGLIITALVVLGIYLSPFRPWQSAVMNASSRRESPHTYNPDELRPVLVQLGSRNETAFANGVLSRKHAPPAPHDWITDDEWEEEDCLPMYEWQLFTPLSCNTMHEIDMYPGGEDSLHIINCGSSRCAYRLKDTDNTTTLVLKLWSYQYVQEDPFYPDTYEHARLDSLSMERLKTSPYILDIYGSCGASQLVEYGQQGNLHDQIKIARQKKDDKFIDPVDKLKIAVHVASAVADLHEVENSTMPALTHNDVCCHQFINIDGVYKLNDFHSGKFTRRHRQTKRVCKELPKDIEEEAIKMRAPEDLVDIFVEEDEDKDLIYRDKTDVYAMGNVLYYLLTSQWIYEGVKLGEARHLLIDGKRPDIPEKFIHGRIPAERAIVKAINAAWTHNPFYRPTAREVANYLGKELRKLVGGKKGDVVRVVLPPLPENHRFTGSDFLENLRYN